MNTTKPNPRAADLLLWAFVNGAKWEPRTSEFGDFVFNGVRYSARVGEDGIPVATTTLLDDIAAARAKRTGGGR